MKTMGKTQSKELGKELIKQETSPIDKVTTFTDWILQEDYEKLKDEIGKVSCTDLLKAIESKHYNHVILNNDKICDIIFHRFQQDVNTNGMKAIVDIMCDANNPMLETYMKKAIEGRTYISYLLCMHESIWREYIPKMLKRWDIVKKTENKTWLRQDHIYKIVECFLKEGWIYPQIFPMMKHIFSLPDWKMESIPDRCWYWTGSLCEFIRVCGIEWYDRVLEHISIQDPMITLLEPLLFQCCQKGDKRMLSIVMAKYESMRPIEITIHNLLNGISSSDISCALLDELLEKAVKRPKLTKHVYTHLQYSTLYKYGVHQILSKYNIVPKLTLYDIMVIGSNRNLELSILRNSNYGEEFAMDLMKSNYHALAHRLISYSAHYKG